MESGTNLQRARSFSGVAKHLHCKPDKSQTFWFKHTMTISEFSGQSSMPSRLDNLEFLANAASAGECGRTNGGRDGCSMIHRHREHPALQISHNGEAHHFAFLVEWHPNVQTTALASRKRLSEFFFTPKTHANSHCEPGWAECGTCRQQQVAGHTIAA